MTVPQANAQLRLAADQFRRCMATDSLPPDGGFGVSFAAESMIGDTGSRLLCFWGPWRLCC